MSLTRNIYNVDFVREELTSAIYSGNIQRAIFFASELYVTGYHLELQEIITDVYLLYINIEAIDLLPTIVTISNSYSFYDIKQVCRIVELLCNLPKSLLIYNIMHWEPIVTMPVTDAHALLYVALQERDLGLAILASKSILTLDYDIINNSYVEMFKQLDRRSAYIVAILVTFYETNLVHSLIINRPFITDAMLLKYQYEPQIGDISNRSYIDTSRWSKLSAYYASRHSTFRELHSEEIDRIIAYLPSIDFVHLTSISKVYRTLYTKQSIWQNYIVSDYDTKVIYSNPSVAYKKLYAERFSYLYGMKIKFDEYLIYSERSVIMHNLCLQKLFQEFAYVEEDGTEARGIVIGRYAEHKVHLQRTPIKQASTIYNKYISFNIALYTTKRTYPVRYNIQAINAGMKAEYARRTALIVGNGRYAIDQLHTDVYRALPLVPPDYAIHLTVIMYYCKCYTVAKLGTTYLKPLITLYKQYSDRFSTILPSIRQYYPAISKQLEGTPVTKKIITKKRI